MMYPLSKLPHDIQVKHDSYKNRPDGSWITFVKVDEEIGLYRFAIGRTMQDMDEMLAQGWLVIDATE